MTDALPDAEIERLRRELGERDDFVALATHEVRNQLHTLGLQLRLAQLALETKDLDTSAERIGKAQATLARYIERVTLMLDLTRLNADAYPLALRDVDVSETLRQIVEGLQSEAQFRAVALRTSLPPQCPALIDASALEHVVSNLLLNAFKHAAARNVTVSLLVLPGGERARIEVADDGQGIAEADRQRIFGKFERDAGSGARTGGSGLGLWIVRKLVAALGGTIGLASRPGAGSTFTIELPLRREGVEPR